MKILFLTPGTGNFHCGSCLRDHGLVTALRGMGHDARLAPMYLPQVFDRELDPAIAGGGSLFFGGLNVYLQQKLGRFGRVPRFLGRVLDSPALLRRSADLAAMTSARDVADVTLSMLAGESGRQVAELDRLVDWLRRSAAPQVVCLNNALLAGLAKRIRDALGVPVVCTLHGEDEFLDTLPRPQRDEAWSRLRRRAGDVGAWIAVSAYYADVMARRLSIDRDAITVVPNGIAPDGFDPAPLPPRRPTIGYLARLRPDKGLAALASAFIELRRGGAVPDAQLCVVGARTPADRSFVRQVRAQLRAAGLDGDTRWHFNVDRARKAELLRGMSVLSVPATYGEAFGLYLLEAWASGVPVVQPRSGAFTELLEQTGAGILVPPDDTDSLARGLARLLNDADLARRMGRLGREAVCERFTDARMAEGVVAVLSSVLERVVDSSRPSRESGAPGA